MVWYLFHNQVSVGQMMVQSLVSRWKEILALNSQLVIQRWYVGSQNTGKQEAVDTLPQPHRYPALLLAFGHVETQEALTLQRLYCGGTAVVCGPPAFRVSSGSQWRNSGSV